MHTYQFTLTPWSVKYQESVCDVLEQTLKFSIPGTSFKNALRKLYKSIEFDKYIHANTTVWVYWKSHFNGKLYPIPEYEDVDIQ